MIRVSLCQRNKSRGILTWYARIFDTETKEIRYESLGTTKKTEANELMLAKHADGEFTRNRRSEITLRRVFELYEKDLESRGGNDNTMTTIRYFFNTLKPLFDRPIASITKIQLMETFNAATEGHKPSTYNNAKTAIRTVFKFARDVLEVIDSSPADGLKSRKNTAKERDFWTLEQIDRILDATRNPLHRLMFAFMAYAGLRIHEALKLKREDLKEGFIQVVGKGNKFAKVPISSRLSAELDRVGWEFDFSAMKKYTIKDSLERSAKRALGKTFTGSANPHRLRHSFASNALRAGIGVHFVQKLMRHASITTTINIYAHLIDNDLSNEIEKMFKNT